MSMQERAAVLEQFRAMTFRMLVTTNVSLRGFDFYFVNIVLNWDLPLMYADQTPDHETYLHRVGRAGRCGRKGVAVSFVEKGVEWQISAIRAFEEHFSTLIEDIFLCIYLLFSLSPLLEEIDIKFVDRTSDN